LAVQAALGLVFDPRYRDFPFAPLTAAALPLLLLVPSARWRPKAPAAETAMAATLAASAVYVAFNEGFANWQALWFSTGLLVFAFTLLQARDAPG
jgi:glucan 1,3-beta-glucosidase